MDGAVYSTYEIRLRAVRAVVDDNLPVTTVALAYDTVDPSRRAEIQGNSLLPRRGEHFADCVVGKDLGSLRTDPQTTGDRKARRCLSDVGNHQPRTTPFRLHDKRICSEEVVDFLSQMLRHHKRRHLVVVMDQAPPHVSKKTKQYIAGQLRLHVFHLPKYSPDWNPDEKVWNHLKHQELKGHQARTKGDLEQLAQRKLERMSEDRRLPQGIFFRCCVAELWE